jgi:hypothetical protein
LANDLEFKYSKNCPTALISEGLVVGGCWKIIFYFFKIFLSAILFLLTPSLIV